MHRVLEETALPAAWPACLSGGDLTLESSPSVHDDVYREDPYRFTPEDIEGGMAKLAAADDLRRIDYLPTPAQIAGACAQIRRGWTICEKRRRFVGELPAEAHDDSVWAPPVVDTSHFRLTAGGVGDIG